MEYTNVTHLRQLMLSELLKLVMDILFSFLSYFNKSKGNTFLLIVLLDEHAHFTPEKKRVSG
jgi:hypothetical protein